MNGERFNYGGKSYVFEEDERVVLRICRSLRKGLVEIHDLTAFRIAAAYKERVQGKPSTRRPRSFARRAKQRRS